MTFSNQEIVILSYISRHPMTRRSTVCESLSFGDWEAGKKIRAALDSLVARQIVQQIGTGKRNLRYQIKETQ
jgi:hypothetical protein